MDRFYTLKKLVVEVEGIAVGGEFRGNLFFDGNEFVVGIGTGQGEKDAGYTTEYTAALLESNECILKGSRLGVVGNGVYFSLVLPYPFFESREIVFYLDTIEVRRSHIGLRRVYERIGCQVGIAFPSARTCCGDSHNCY